MEPELRSVSKTGLCLSLSVYWRRHEKSRSTCVGRLLMRPTRAYVRTSLPHSRSTHLTYFMFISATYTTPIGSSSVTFVDSVPVENPPSYDN